MVVILGINAFHADSAACLVVDGQLLGAIAEERLGPRVKHSSAFPSCAILKLLSDANLTLLDVTHVAIARDPKANFLSKINYVLRRPFQNIKAVLQHLNRNSETSGVVDQLAEICGVDAKKLSIRLIHVEHHLAHIASAYYLSPFEGLTAGFSYDGSGDFVSLMAAKCEGNRIDIVDKVLLPNSLGFFYTAMCQFIGFNNFGEEYKVMGLAPYGDDIYRDEMAKLVKLDAGSWFELGKGYFGMHNGEPSGHVDESGSLASGIFYTDKLVKLFGKPRFRGDPIGKRELDLAKSTQVRFEEAAIHALNKLHKLVPTSNLVMAGGCALNGVTNARILRDTQFSEMYIQPASSDDGTSLGAAYYTWHHILGNQKRFSMKHAFWGPEYSDDEIRKVAEGSDFLCKICIDQDDLVESASKLIADGLVIGWYQGKSEWGPRALGNRSILANPGIATMKETINLKIKRRESFRPFAPSVLKEDVDKYFEQNIESPFMMHVVKIRPQWRELLPAITHVDGTGRLQSVDGIDNPLYYKLITAFKARTGIGMVLNTSFNENEPVVDTPQQALDCFIRTDMDALCLGRFILKKY